MSQGAVVADLTSRNERKWAPWLDASRTVAALRQADDLSGGNPMVLGGLGRSLSLLAQTDEARQILRRLTPLKLGDAPAADVAALIHTGLGDLEAAFDGFERAAREGSYVLCFLNVSPVFDPLRSHPRFGALQRLVGLT